MAERNGHSVASALRMECLGLPVGECSVPPFRLHAGEALCLHVGHGTIPWYEQLLPLFEGKLSHPAFRLHGIVRRLERPVPRRRWWGGLQDLRARDWLAGPRALSSAEAQRVLERAGVSSEMHIGRIGWNERTMLALEAVLVRPPDVLLFDTAGNDPLGCRRIFDRVASRPPGLTLVYFKTDPVSNEPCCPGASCLELSVQSRQMAARE